MEDVTRPPTFEELQERTKKATQALASRGQGLNVDPLWLAYRIEALERLVTQNGLDTSRLDYLTELCRAEDLEDKVKHSSPIIAATAIPTRPS